MAGSCVIGIDIGGTNFRIGAVTSDRNLIYPEKMSSRTICTGGDSLSLLSRQLEEYIDRHSLRGAVGSISIGFPSPVSRDRKTVLSCPNLHNDMGGFDGVDVVTAMSSRFGIPVFVNKDAVFLLQYDITSRGLEDCGTVIGIYYGTGIGNSVYINHEYLSGKHGSATDVEHIPFYLSDRYCTCGNRGCAGCYGAGWALRKLWEERYSSVPFEDLFVTCGEDTPLVNFVEAMSIPLASEINIFDPDCVIIGGGVVAMRSFPIDRFRYHLHEFARKPFPGDDYDFYITASDPFAGVRGAAYFAMERQTNRV